MPETVKFDPLTSLRFIAAAMIVIGHSAGYWSVLLILAYVIWRFVECPARFYINRSLNKFFDAPDQGWERVKSLIYSILRSREKKVV